MSELKGLEQAFLDTLADLRSELPHLVIVGGWCPYLYAQYLWKKPIPNLPTTMDVDLGVAETGPRKFGTTVYDRLKRFSPAASGLLDAVARLKSHEYFEAFRRNLTDHLADPSRPGYLMLRPFVAQWMAERAVNNEIEETFRDLLRL